MICAQCGKEFCPLNLKDYTYKRRDNKTHKTNTFCSNSCMTAWDKDHPRKTYNAGFMGGKD